MLAINRYATIYKTTYTHQKILEFGEAKAKRENESQAQPRTKRNPTASDAAAHPTLQLSNHPTIQPATWPPFPDPPARGPHPDLDQTREYATRSNPNHSALRENDS